MSALARRSPSISIVQPAAALLLVLAAACGTTGNEGKEPAIPPGREEMLSAMLGAGATLPGDCKFAGGGVKHSVVAASYACAGGPVSFELAHPSRAGSGAGAVVTEKFAIVTKQGTPPPELVTALTELVRKREGEFEWVWLAGDAAASESSSSIPITALAVGGLVVIGFAGWMLRRRAPTPGD